MMEWGRDVQFEGHMSVEWVMFSSRVLLPIPSLIVGRKNWTPWDTENQLFYIPPKILLVQVKILYLVVLCFIMLGSIFRSSVQCRWLISVIHPFIHSVTQWVIQSFGLRFIWSRGLIPLVHWFCSLSVIRQTTIAHLFLYRKLCWVWGMQQW